MYVSFDYANTIFIVIFRRKGLTCEKLVISYAYVANVEKAWKKYTTI